MVKRADIDNDLSNTQKLRYFIRGLKPEIAPIVAMTAPDNVIEALRKAQQYENGQDLINYEEPKKIVGKNTIQEDPMDKLIKKFEKMQLNLAERIELLTAQVENNRSHPNNRTYTTPPRSTPQRSQIICYKCNEPGHIARDCLSEKFVKPRSNNSAPNRRINYIEASDEEEEDEEEIYSGMRGRPRNDRSKPYETNRNITKEKTKKSESAKELNLRTRRIIPDPMETEEESEEIIPPIVPPKVQKPRMKSQPSIIDQLSPYDISEDILKMQSHATLGQMLQYPSQRRNLVKILKRPKRTAETNYLHSADKK